VLSPPHSKSRSPFSDAARAEFYKEEQQKKLATAKSIVETRVKSMGSLEAVKDFSDGVDAEALTVRRALNLISSQDHDFSKLREWLRSPEKRDPDRFMS